MSSLRLGVNVDHVATLRQARYATMPESKNAEPDPLVAARLCERAAPVGSLRIFAVIAAISRTETSSGFVRIS